MNGINPIQTIGGVDGGAASLKRPLNTGLLDGGDLIPAKKASEAGDFNTMGDADKVVDIYQVPEKVVGLVIGKGGSEIRNIQQTSGCRVQMDPDHQTVNGFRNCTIEGPAQQVALARQLIDNILNRQAQGGPGGQGGGHGEVTEEMLIPAEKCGLVIGKGGETIRTVQEQAGLRSINVVQDSTAPTGQPKPLRMVGLPGAIETAKMLVMNIMNTQPGGGGGMGGGHGAGQMMRAGGYGGQEAQAKGEVIVPRLSAGMIIGRGGEMIKRLAQETGTKIQFKPDENPNSEDRVAVIMGTRDQIYRATERITEIVNRAIKNNGGSVGQQGSVGGGGGGGQNIFYMHVPANKCGLVIGKGGENIKQIERETGATCGLAPASEQKKEDEKVFEIKGTPSQIHHASHLVKIKVGEIAPNTPVPTMQGAVGGFQGGYAPSNGHFPPAQPAQGYVQQQQPQQQQYGLTQPWGANGGASAGQDLYSAAAVVQQPQAVVPQAAAQPDPSAPSVNPTTGAPDYSAQWAAYYRSIGLNDQAAMVENQMRRNQSAGDASGAAVGGAHQAYYPHPQ